jgi:hypothetical protein
MPIMETQVSKLTLSHTPEQNRVGWFQSQTPDHVKVINGHPKGKPWNLPPEYTTHREQEEFKTMGQTVFACLHNQQLYC